MRELNALSPTFWLTGTGRSSSSLPEESLLFARFVLSAGFAGAAVLPGVALACFSTAVFGAVFGAVFPWDSGSVFAGAALLESDAAGVVFTGDRMAWEVFKDGFDWTRQERTV